MLRIPLQQRPNKVQEQRLSLLKEARKKFLGTDRWRGGNEALPAVFNPVLCGRGPSLQKKKKKKRTEAAGLVVQPCGLYALSCPDRRFRDHKSGRTTWPLANPMPKVIFSTRNKVEGNGRNVFFFANIPRAQDSRCQQHNPMSYLTTSLAGGNVPTLPSNVAHDLWQSYEPAKVTNPRQSIHSIRCEGCSGCVNYTGVDNLARRWLDMLTLLEFWQNRFVSGTKEKITRMNILCLLSFGSRSTR